MGAETTVEEIMAVVMMVAAMVAAISRSRLPCLSDHGRL